MFTLPFTQICDEVYQSSMDHFQFESNCLIETIHIFVTLRKITKKKNYLEVYMVSNDSIDKIDTLWF